MRAVTVANLQLNLEINKASVGISFTDLCKYTKIVLVVQNFNIALKKNSFFKAILRSLKPNDNCPKAFISF